MSLLIVVVAIDLLIWSVFLKFIVLISGFEIASKRLFQPLYHINFIWNLTNHSKRLQESLQFARSVFEKVYISMILICTVEELLKSNKFNLHCMNLMKFVDFCEIPNRRLRGDWATVIRMAFLFWKNC